MGSSPLAPGVCLCMIVKNEAPVIRRCLDSVLPLISHWVIVDTGSGDGTQQLIREHMRNIPGTLYERPWRDFAYNRSEALTLARPHGDYSLIIDADDVLELPSDFQRASLIADAYSMNIVDGPLSYTRLQLVSNKQNWFYRGVLHEFLACDGETIREHLNINMRRGHDGARRRNPEIYSQDAAILEKALTEEADPVLRSRYTFYLAQSYRDCRQPQQAIARYRERAALGGWAEEVYYSHYQAAKLLQSSGAPDEAVLVEYQKATDALPARNEARHGASRLCRLRGLHARGYAIAKEGLGKPLPAGVLFAEPWIYDTGLRDEFAVNAYWAGHYAESLDACLSLIESGKMPAAELPRIIANVRAAASELARAFNPASPALNAATITAAAPTEGCMPCSAGVIREIGDVKGRGVFASRAIAAGEVVEACPVMMVQWDLLPPDLQRMVFDWGYLTGGPANCALVFGWGSLYNHGNPANLRYSASAGDQRLVFCAARDIAAGEELTINYNRSGGDVHSTEDVWFERAGILPV